MKLSTYIALYCADNKTEFARALKVHAPQVHQWIKNDAEVIAGRILVSARRVPAMEIPEVNNERFEAMLLTLNPSVDLTKVEGEYTDKFVRGANAMLRLMRDVQDNQPKYNRDDVILNLKSAEEAMKKIREAIGEAEDDYF